MCTVKHCILGILLEGKKEYQVVNSDDIMELK